MQTIHHDTGLTQEELELKFLAQLPGHMLCDLE